MEQIWLTWAKQLQATTSTGVHFANDPYDQVRYTKGTQIAQQMLSALGRVPIEKIEGSVTDCAKGYATPRIDVRGAVIQNDQIFLVREKANELWSLPGGYTDVGLSAAENVAKEISEEEPHRLWEGVFIALGTRPNTPIVKTPVIFKSSFSSASRPTTLIQRRGWRPVMWDFSPQASHLHCPKGASYRGILPQHFTQAGKQHHQRCLIKPARRAQLL